MRNKWTSRKFWIAVSAEIVGIVTLVWGLASGAQAEVIAGAVIAVLVALGYLQAESKVDAEREKSNANKS